MRIVESVVIACDRPTLSPMPCELEYTSSPASSGSKVAPSSLHCRVGSSAPLIKPAIHDAVAGSGAARQRAGVRALTEPSEAHGGHGGDGRHRGDSARHLAVLVQLEELWRGEIVAL